MLRITRQTQSVSLLRQGSAGPRERPADGAAETIRKQGANFAHPGLRGKRRPTWATPQPRKGFQNLGLGGILSSLSFAAERKGAVGDIKTAALGKRIATAAERPRNDRFFFMNCDAIPGGEVWSPRPTGARSAVGRDDVGIGPYETMTRNVAHNTADAKCFPAASGQRGPA